MGSGKVGESTYPYAFVDLVVLHNYTIDPVEEARLVASEAPNNKSNELASF